MIESYVLGIYLAALPLDQLSVQGITVLKWVGALAFGVWVITRVRSFDPIRWDRSMTLMALFVAWGMVSVLWSVDPALSMGSIPTYLLLFVSYFLIVNVIQGEKQLSVGMIALWLGVLVLLVSGVLDMAGIRQQGETYRVGGVTGNPNGYVALLVACIPSGYWFLSRTRFPLRRAITVGALAVAGVTAIYTQSRGGIISIAVFFLVLLAYRRTRGRALVLAALVVILVLRAAPLAFWERWQETQSQGGDVRTKELWPAGMRAIEQRPFTGYGLGTNQDALRMVRGGAGGTEVHNAPLAIGIELGLPGLALYLGFIAYSVVRLLRALAATARRGISKEAALFAAVLLASFAGYLVNWLKGGGMEYSKMLWVELGLMNAYVRLLEPPQRAAVRPRRPLPGRSMTRVQV
ncbi:MAG TPA: O-antigen ligase family protein [bacterium]|nr:O-antigen ligase family protein [bacterium]